jgi:hypothetical protein
MRNANLFKIAFILLYKENIIFYGVELVLKCVLIMYAEFLSVIVNLSPHNKTIKKGVSYLAPFFYLEFCMLSDFNSQFFFVKNMLPKQMVTNW